MAENEPKRTVDLSRLNQKDLDQLVGGDTPPELRGHAAMLTMLREEGFPDSSPEALSKEWTVDATR
jgi:hypothetical protein